jgi:uncharacterized membrane protein
MLFCALLCCAVQITKISVNQLAQADFVKSLRDAVVAESEAGTTTADGKSVVPQEALALFTSNEVSMSEWVSE